MLTFHGNAITTNNIGTGSKIDITCPQNYLYGEYTAVVYGDVNGDGDISLSDLVSVRDYLLGANPLNDISKQAGDIYGEGDISLNDLVGMMSYISGSGSIDQNQGDNSGSQKFNMDSFHTITSTSLAIPNTATTVSATSDNVQSAQRSIIVGTMFEGTITADKASTIVGDTVNLNITPNSCYQLTPGSLKYSYGGQDYNITGTSFTMPDADVSITAEFEAVSKNPPVNNMLNADMVSLSGSLGADAQLAITPVNQDSAVYEDLICGVQADLTMAYDISVTGTHQFPLTLSFDVGIQYNGRMVTVNHKLANGNMDKLTTYVYNGKVSFGVTELGKFSVLVLSAK